MKPHSEMNEGPEAFERFRQAVKKVLTVTKSTGAANPFGKSGKTRKKSATPKE